MKKLFLIPLLIIFVTMGCKKDPVIHSSPTTSTPPTPPPPPPAPKAFAGSSKFVALPADSCLLYGGSSGNNIENYSWYKISGPASYVIEYPHSISTKVYNLKKGIYEFELTVMNNSGLSGKDTVTVSVYDVASATKEIILKDLQWSCPMGCYLEIPNFHSFVPVGTFFRVYIKRDNFPEWIEVIHTDQSRSTDRYIFSLCKKILWIDSGTDAEDTPDVKITF